MNKLIFIEGVSGVGKTTATSLLRNKLWDMGGTFTYHLEGDHDNPLDPFKGTYPPAMPLTEFVETYMNYWRCFMESQIKQEKRLILDGTLLHHQVPDLVRNYDASDETIVTHLKILLQIIQPLNPVIFYLASRNVCQQLLRARESRGQSLPTQEQIAFWENRKRIDLLVLDRLPIHSHILNIDSGWDLVLQTMAEYIIK